MGLHDDLLEQARFLAQKKDSMKPTQANLRRSVSASYYALFHFLIDEATKLMLPGRNQILRDCLARAFRHKDMRDFAKVIADSNHPTKLVPAFNGQPLEQKLIKVASTFCKLQQARHEADYNRLSRFSRREVLIIADKAEQAFDAWDEVKIVNKDQAEIFLIGLLNYKNIQN